MYEESKPQVDRALVRGLRDFLEGRWGVDKVYRDYILCTRLFHCTPVELEQVAEYQLQLMRELYIEELKTEDLKRKRAEQKASLVKRK